jgi:hypothetical protein
VPGRPFYGKRHWRTLAHQPLYLVPSRLGRSVDQKTQKTGFWIFLSLLFIGLLTGVVSRVGFGSFWFEFDRPSVQQQEPSVENSSCQLYDCSDQLGYPPGGWDAGNAGDHPGCWYVSNCGLTP